MLGKAAYSGDNYVLARDCFYELLPLVDKIPKEHPYNVLSLNWHIATLDFETGNFKEARNRCDLISSKYGYVGKNKNEIELLDKIVVLGNKARKKE
jgi:hypothetical protein